MTLFNSKHKKRKKIIKEKTGISEWCIYNSAMMLFPNSE